MNSRVLLDDELVRHRGRVDVAAEEIRPRGRRRVERHPHGRDREGRAPCRRSLFPPACCGIPPLSVFAGRS